MPPDEDQHHDNFLRLFAVSEPALRAFVRSLVPRREDLPEVMQEVAVVLWRKFGDLAAPVRHAAQPGDLKWRLQYARAAIAAGLPHYDNNGVTDMGPDGWWQWATQTS